MFIRLGFVYLFILVSQILATCPYIRTSVILADCVFDTNLYISLGAHIFNTNSIDFIGHYSFHNNNNNNHTENHLTNTLIYNLGNRWMLLLPLLLKCSHQPLNLTFTECQYTMRQHKHTSRSSSITEYMTTQLSVINVTNLGMQSVLFLQPGEITLRSCKAYDCSKQLVYLTASNETFNLKIDFEKPIGTKCYSNAECSNRYSINDLIYCDQISQTCQCYNENITRIDIPNIGRVCTDAIDRSNCSKFPQRCLQWCDESKTSHCICPKHTRKVRKINGVFDCELEPTGKCRFDDDDIIGINIRKCPTETICYENQCRPRTILQKIYKTIRDDTTLHSSTPSMMINLFSSPTTESVPITTSFIYILIIMSIVSLLCFILIIFIITMLIKTRRCRLLSSSEDKASSSSSFVQSTSTAISTDFSNEIYQFQQLPIISKDYSRRYDNYLIARPTFIHGIVPQTNLSPRFHRRYQGLDRIQRRAPLQIKSPSLSRVNTYSDHGLLTTNNYDNANKQNHLPTVTHLQNGDVLISA